MYDVLIRGERWIVLMLSPIVRDVQRQRCSKLVVAEMGRDLVFMITARLSDLFHAIER